MAKITKDSHTDHNLTEGQLAFVREKIEALEGFSIQTFDLPDVLGTVPCALHGPNSGQDRVPESEVYYAIRGNRKGASRMVTGFVKPVQVRQVTVIVGPTNSDGTILYTAYGGKASPREPWDQSIGSWDELLESRHFWSEHALSPE